MAIHIEEKIAQIAAKYAQTLETNLKARIAEMEQDDQSHFLIYRALGISHSEGQAIDLYQNKGRFVYRYAGSFLEAAAKQCFSERYPEASPLKIPNPTGTRPKTFEIDCLIGTRAYEIKWRDATTDGDHITKEHSRLRAIAAAGYTPIRLMFYYPNRQQAIKIQALLQDLYRGLGGAYYHGEAAWEHLSQVTGIDLKRIIEKIAQQRGENG